MRLSEDIVILLLATSKGIYGRLPSILIRASAIHTTDYNSVSDLTSLYTSTLREIMDNHAPVITKKIILRPHSPWYTDELRAAKRERRKAERKWQKKTGLTIHHDIFLTKCNETKKLLLDTKKTYFSQKIDDCGKDSKQLFKLTKTLMGDSNEVILPTCSENAILANMFCDYFLGKIVKIRNGLSERGSCTDALNYDKAFSGDQLCVFPQPQNKKFVNLSSILPESPVSWMQCQLLSW